MKYKKRAGFPHTLLYALIGVAAGIYIAFYFLGYDNPWGENFEPTLVYGPVTGAMGYVSVRVNLGHRLN